MSKCIKCGKPMDDRLLACPECGHSISDGLLNLSKEQENLILKKLWHRLFKYLFGSISVIGIVSLIIMLIGLYKSYNKGIAYLELTIVNKVSDEFKEPNITNTIEKVAKEKAEELMLAEIKPEIVRFKEQIQTSVKEIGEKANQIEKILSEAKIVLEDINDVSEFSMTITKAMNDDRNSFDYLLNIGNTEGHKFQLLAQRSVSQIIEYLDRFSILQYRILWSEKHNIDPKTATLKDFDRAYRNEIPSRQVAVIDMMWNQKRFHIYERLNFLYNVLKNSQSIKCLHKACELMDQEAHLDKNIIAYEQYIKWWEENRELFRNKKEEETIKSSDNN